MTLEVLIEGAGPAFVVLPSYGRDGGADFDDLAARIAAAGFAVLRPQPRGIAGSVGAMHSLTLTDLAGDIALAIRTLGAGPAIVLGHAFGSFVARVLATEHAALVRGVILAAAAASKVADDINETPFIAGDPARPEADRLAALQKAFFAPGHDARPWLSGWHAETLAMQRAAVAATDTAQYLAAGAAPLLEIIPRGDPFKPPFYWRELSDRLGDRVTTVLIDDAAHALVPERPEPVAEAVIAWSRDPRAGGRVQ